MKKILFILLFGISLVSVGQITTFQETFGNSATPTTPTGWAITGGQWSVDAAVSNGGFLSPDCNAAPTSSNCKLVATNGAATGIRRIRTNSFSTTGFTNLFVRWNGLRQSGAPSVTLQISTNSGFTGATTLAYTDVTSDGAWHNLTPISIPVSFESQSTVYIRWSYTSDASGNKMAYDDITVYGTASPIFYWNGSGAVHLLSSWGLNGDGSGSNPTDFTSNNQVFNLVNASSANLTSPLTIGGTDTKFMIGDGATGINFNLSSILSFTDGATMDILNTSTLTLQNNTFPNDFDVNLIDFGSTVNYAQSSNVSVWALDHYNLTISGSSEKSLPGGITVEGILNLNGQNLNMTNTIFDNFVLNGPIVGSGALRTGASRLTISGSGSIGTINFSPGFTALSIGQLILNRPGQTLTLGSDLIVTGATNLSNGTLNLNGKHLTMNGNVTFHNTISNGSIIGSKTGSITVGGSGSITNSLLMSQSTATTRALADLTLNRASTTLGIGNALEIWSTVTPSVGTIAAGGNLTIKQDATNKGRIGIISTGGFSGNVTAECYAPGPTTGWALLGAHGIAGQTMNNWYGQFPMALEGSGTGVMSAGGYFESVQGWNEGDAYGYDSTITVSTALNPAQGFWVYLGSGQFTTTDFTILLTGNPVTGTVNIPLTNSAQSGTCLIANPFASPISWTALRNGNSAVANAVYIYNANGPYASFVGGVGTNGGSDILPSGQGFYVEALSNTNLTALETNKVASNTNLMKTNASSNTSNVGLPIKLNINGFSGDFDETAIRFHGSTTNAFDTEWDAHKIFQTPGYVGYPGGYSKYTTISTKGGNIDYSINSLPFALTQNAVIPVLVKVMASGQYTITGQDMQLLPPGACVTLKDKLLNVTHNIKASPYVCTINDTTSAARFELTVCADITTGINDNNISVLDQSVFVKQDISGIDVDLNFDKTTKANISVTNILGQKIVSNKAVTAQNETVRFGLEPKNQLLFITVETENNKVTKKIIH